MKKSHTIILWALLIPTQGFAGDWVNDWLEENGVVGEPSYYQGGNRTYLSGGNISVRANNSIDYPFTISPPRIQTRGCGVDLYMGGLSYMDSDYLVEKFEGIIANAEVVAFQLGVSALSDKLSTIVEGMEEITNYINGLQLDECAIAKSAVTTIVDGNASDAPNAVWREISQGQTLDLGVFRNATESNEELDSNDGQPHSSVDATENINACPEPVKALYSEGSVVANLTDNYGMSEYAEYIRGYIGDVIITHQGAGNLPVGITKTYCSGNDNRSLDDFVFGHSYVASEPDESDIGRELTCSLSGSVSLIDVADNTLDQLITILTTPSMLLEDSPGLLNFLNNSPVPAIPLMEIAIANGVEQQVKDDLKYTIAYGYSYKIINDLYRNTMTAINRAESAKSGNTVDEPEESPTPAEESSSQPKCDLKPYVFINEHINSLKSRLENLRKDVSTQYMAHLEQTNAIAKLIDRVSRVNRKSQ